MVAEVGPWAKEKLDILARYLDFYTKVLKNQPWRTIYIDAFAGGGSAKVRIKTNLQQLSTYSSQLIARTVNRRNFSMDRPE